MNGPDDAPSELVCVAEEGSVDHDWKYIADWSGDPGVVNGTYDFGYWECRVCGLIDEEREPPTSYDDCADPFF